MANNQSRRRRMSRQCRSTTKIMRDVVIALMLTLVVSALLFEWTCWALRRCRSRPASCSNI